MVGNTDQGTPGSEAGDRHPDTRGAERTPAPLHEVRQLAWDKRFLRLAREVAQWSKDPSTQVGAVIVRPNRTVVSLGYNGFPRGFPDHEHLYADRERKYRYVVHAELNAIVTAREPLVGFTIYTWPLPPCQECCKAIIQSGITRVVSVEPTDEQLGRYRDSFAATNAMLDCCEIKYALFNRDRL
jgi:dCMP deaminase